MLGICQGVLKIKDDPLAGRIVVLFSSYFAGPALSINYKEYQVFSGLYITEGFKFGHILKEVSNQYRYQSKSQSPNPMAYIQWDRS